MFKRNSNNVFQTIFLLALLLFGHSSASAQDARLVAKHIFPSIVMLEMRDDKNHPISLGSGFFVRPDIVVTNYHVIEGASDGFAKIVGKTSIYRIEAVVGIDEAKDLVLLKLTGANGKPLVLADVSKIEVGQEVFALGNPKGLEGTISPGIISGSTLRQVSNEDLIQITAPISPGSSGGPVVNRRGEVLGVAVLSIKGGQNLNFAIPSSYLAILLAKSRTVSTLSDLSRRSENFATSDSEASLVQVTAWITENLDAKGGVTGSFFQKNESLVIENCSMKLVVSSRLAADGRFQIRWAYIAQLNKLTRAYVDTDYAVYLEFPRDSLRVRREEYFDGKLDKSENSRADGLDIWVGDKETGLRVIKAFTRISNLCREQIGSDPF